MLLCHNGRIQVCGSVRATNIVWCNFWGRLLDLPNLNPAGSARLTDALAGMSSPADHAATGLPTTSTPPPSLVMRPVAQPAAPAAQLGRVPDLGAARGSSTNDLVSTGPGGDEDPLRDQGRASSTVKAENDGRPGDQVPYAPLIGQLALQKGLEKSV
jgi:hypothetical protein